MPKYHSKNRLEDFEFHDSYVTINSFKGGVLDLSIEMLNIHSDAEQNTCGCDMEIEKTHITFSGVTIDSVCPLSSVFTDTNGNKYIFTTKFEGDTIETLKVQLLDRFKIYSLQVLPSDSKQKISVDFDRIDIIINIVLSFDSVEMEWDNFNGKAWYVRD